VWASRAPPRDRVVRVRHALLLAAAGRPAAARRAVGVGEPARRVPALERRRQVVVRTGQPDQRAGGVHDQVGVVPDGDGVEEGGRVLGDRLEHGLPARVPWRRA
jgi:hypothetical protein